MFVRLELEEALASGDMRPVDRAVGQLRSALLCLKLPGSRPDLRASKASWDDYNRGMKGLEAAASVLQRVLLEHVARKEEGA